MERDIYWKIIEASGHTGPATSLHKGTNLTFRDRLSRMTFPIQSWVTKMTKNCQIFSLNFRHSSKTQKGLLDFKTFLWLVDLSSVKCGSVVIKRKSKWQSVVRKVPKCWAVVVGEFRRTKWRTGSNVVCLHLWTLRSCNNLANHCNELAVISTHMLYNVLAIVSPYSCFLLPFQITV